MDLHPGSLLGLPPGLPHPSHVAALRWGLLGLAWVWAAIALRGRSHGSLLPGLAFGAVAVGFWALALGRPYGLLVDAASTRRAADAAVIAATGDERLGFVVGSPPAPGLQARLATLGLAPPLLLLLPSFLPLLAHLSVALLVALLLPTRERAPLGAALWLAFPSCELELIRGDGFLGVPWRRPEGLATLVPVVAVLFLLGRARRFAWPALGAGIALATAWAALVPRAVEPGRLPIGGFLTLTLDQGPFLLLGAWGVSRGVDATTRFLLVVGALLVAVAQAAPFFLDAWCGQVLYRLGILLASCGPIEELERRVGAFVRSFLPLARLSAAAVGRALLLAVAVPASALAWWSPIQLDGRVGERSVEPLSRQLLEAMDWIRHQTDARAVFVASPEYAPAVAAVAGRRVLRAPTLAQPPDSVRRQAQKAAVEGLPDPTLARFGVGYVLVGPGETEELGLNETEAEGRGLREVFRGEDGGFIVYALAAR